jgi:hypothetical protein
MSKYFICNENWLLAFNPKCASNSFAYAILKRYYPEFLKKINPQRLATDQLAYHNKVPKRFHPDRPVIQIFRDPVEKFKSSVAFLELLQIVTVEEIIEDLINETDKVLKIAKHTNKRIMYHRFCTPIYKNIHFLIQERFHAKDLHYFRMHDQLEKAAELLDLDFPLKRINPSKTAEKPVLTKSQIDQIQEYYAIDMARWDFMQA